MVTYRPIVAPDATTIARIHATSWRSAYRGILPDEYLDDDIDADRLTHWRRRLSAPTERDVGVLALQDGAPVGFGFAVRDDDERWGSMLDNLHVLPEHKGHGLGRSLMRELVAQLAEAGTAAACTSGCTKRMRAPAGSTNGSAPCACTPRLSIRPEVGARVRWSMGGPRWRP